MTHTNDTINPLWLGPRNQVAAPAVSNGNSAAGAMDLDAFDMDSLAEAMAAGRFGGVSLSGNAPATLLALLKSLGWKVDMPAFARAMPHFPSQFGASDLRNVARLLGYRSTNARLLGQAITQSHHTLMATDPNSGELLILHRTASGHSEFRNPDTGQTIAIQPKTSYQAVIFSSVKSGAEKSRSTARWTTEIWRRFTPELRLLMGLMLISNLLAIAASFWIMSIFDTAIPSGAVDTLILLMVGLAGIFALDLSVRSIRARIIGHISGRLEYILGTAMFSKLLSFPVELVAASPINDQISRLKQFETIRDFFNGSLVAVILELPFLVLLLGVIFWMHPVLGGATAGLVVLYALVGVIFFPELSRASANYSRRRSEHMTVLLETLDQRKTIARTGITEVWADRLDELNAAAVAARLKLDRVHSMLTVTAGSTTPMAAGTVILLGATLVMDGQLTAGTLVAVTILVWRLFAPIQQGLLVATRLPDLTRLLAQIDAMMRIGGVEDSATTGLRQTLTPHLQVEGLFLRYPGSAVAALAGVEFQVEPGQFVGITGPSGSGKTTLLRAIAGHYRPQSGSIRLGGTNIRQLRQQSISSDIAYVTETSLVFHGTLAQNLRLASPAATPEDLRRVAEELGYLSLVDELPEGFDTRLDYARSNLLTPGFKSLIAISQAFLRSPGVVLMDEPAAVLGQEADAHLMRAIEARRGSTTILMVSHNSRHLETVDQLLTLSAGRQIDFSPPKRRAS